MTSAALQGAAVLTAAATAGPDPVALWIVYADAVAQASRAWEKLHEVHMAGGSSGLNGQLYTAAYQAQRAAEQAYAAWLAAQHQAVAGARG